MTFRAGNEHTQKSSGPNVSALTLFNMTGLWLIAVFGLLIATAAFAVEYAYDRVLRR